MTEEHKAKMAEARKKKADELKALGLPTRKAKVKKEKAPKLTKKEKEALEKSKKPTLYITGEEKTGFDFWTSLRSLYRSRGDYSTYRIIEKEIVHKSIWNNISIIKVILAKYVILEPISEKNVKRFDFL